MDVSSHLVPPRRGWRVPLLLTLLAAFLIARTLAAATGHDEDQYIGGAWAADRRVVFRDFIYLQTPLQAWLFAPLVDWLMPHAFVGLRLVNACLGAATLCMLYATARQAGCRSRPAAVAVVLVCSTEIFSYSATTLRNDMLPTAFLSLFLLAAVIAIQRRSAHIWFIAGLCIGLAVAAKISFALPALAALLFLAQRALGDPSDHRDLLACAAGGAVAMLPVMAAFLLAPEAFRFATVGYHATATFDWYAANGLQGRLALGGKADAFIDYLAQGPALAMLVVLILFRLRIAPRPHRAAVVRMLDFVTVGGLIAAWIPTPSWAPYLVVVLPPLAVQFALCLEERRRIVPSRALRVAAGAALVGLGLIGLSKPIGDARAAIRGGLPILGWERQAHWLGDTLRACHVEGTVASLTARWVVDSGYELDTRFTAGVFVFRSGRLLSPDQARRLNVVTPGSLADALDARPPAAIVTGDQGGSAFFPLRPDMPLIHYARSRGWTRIDHPGGRPTVFINPAAVAPARDRPIACGGGAGG